MRLWLQDWKGGFAIPEMGKASRAPGSGGGGVPLDVLTGCVSGTHVKVTGGWMCEWSSWARLEVECGPLSLQLLLRAWNLAVPS